MLSGIVLKVMTPDLRQRIFSLPVGYYTIGRNQLQRNNMLISSQHCRFEVSDDGQILIQDSNSLNKTYVNQHLAFTPTPIGPNDVIEIADLTAFVVESN
jgi:pSer/pThr/pTyr-binding forkhead associated (FHA) protein